jgi:predicted RNA-binding protein YlxR (DUF448 family)
MKPPTAESGRHKKDRAPKNDEHLDGNTSNGEPVRLCVVCRNFRPRNELLRLTLETSTGAVKLNCGKEPVHGRSAYLCRSQTCLAQALKGARLKVALEGRKGKNVQNRRTVKWPLEPQLIQQITSQCTEP